MKNVMDEKLVDLKTKVVERQIKIVNLMILIGFETLNSKPNVKLPNR